jgi:hypothetical protein
MLPRVEPPRQRVVVEPVRLEGCVHRAGGVTMSNSDHIDELQAAPTHRKDNATSGGGCVTKCVGSSFKKHHGSYRKTQRTLLERLPQERPEAPSRRVRR